MPQAHRGHEPPGEAVVLPWPHAASRGLAGGATLLVGTRTLEPVAARAQKDMTSTCSLARQNGERGSLRISDARG